MEKLFFVGIKHSGKTTFAKRIAMRFGYEFSDADGLILEHLDGESIRDFYKREGKDAFMSIEKKAIEEYLESNDKNIVLSLGGGAADNEALMSTLKKSGKIIYLTRKESEILPVILKHGIPAFLDPNNLEGSFHAIYEKRDNIYKLWADSIIDLGTYRDKDETEEALYHKMRNLGYGI